MKLQRPTRKGPGLKLRKFLNDGAIDGRNLNRTRADKRRIEPECSVFVLMIELRNRRRWMMRCEMPVNDLGVPVFRFGDVDMLGRQQRQAEQSKDGDEREWAPECHCGNY